MDTLLVGGSGFLGKQILHSLNLAGHNVTIMNRELLPQLECGQIQADIFTPESYRKRIEDLRPQWVIQTAWVSQSENYRYSSKNSLYKTATIDFAIDCFKSGVEQLMILGSSAEYGSQGLPCDSRKSVPMPSDPYGISKFETFQILMDISRSYSCSFTWPRIFQVYGKGQDSNRLIPSVVDCIKFGRSMKIDNPKSVFDWISSRDVASALMFCLNNRISGSVDIGTGVPHSVEEVLEQLVKLINVSHKEIPRISFGNEANSHSSLSVSPNSLIFEKGWLPSDDLVEGLGWVIEE
jgi:nucleoside-diphosphate-sugar epimerase